MRVVADRLEVRCVMDGLVVIFPEASPELAILHPRPFLSTYPGWRAQSMVDEWFGLWAAGEIWGGGNK